MNTELDTLDIVDLGTASELTQGHKGSGDELGGFQRGMSGISDDD